jgi:hypothetical protein
MSVAWELGHGPGPRAGAGLASVRSRAGCWCGSDLDSWRLDRRQWLGRTQVTCTGLCLNRPPYDLQVIALT